MRHLGQSWLTLAQQESKQRHCCTQIVGLAHQVRIARFCCCVCASVLLSSNENVKLSLTLTHSIGWMAPECLRGEDFDEKSDIYSFGVVLYEIMERKVPWEGRDPVQVIGAVGFRGDRLPLPPAVPFGCPEGLLNVISCCWAQNPHERPPFDLILPFLRTWILESQTVFT